MGADDGRVGGVNHVLDVLRPRVAEDAACLAAQSVRGDLRPVHLRVVLADDRQRVARGQPQLEQPHREVHHLIVDLVPAVFLPDAVTLLALRNSIARLGNAPQETLRKRILFRAHRLDHIVQQRCVDRARRRFAIGDPLSLRQRHLSAPLRPGKHR